MPPPNSWESSGVLPFLRDWRFGSAINAHTHLHCCITDGVFSLDADGTLRFHPAAAQDAAATSIVQHRIRSRVLRTAVRHGALSPDVAADLARWGHGGGFSLHATVRIEADDRAGLERLLRYCARPAFASERLTWDGPDQPVRYTLPKPLPSGQTELTLAPLELLDRLAALIPPPRRHRHHYFGVFAPHASWRARVTACAGNPVTAMAPATVPAPTPLLPAAARRRASLHWARLLAQMHEIQPLTSPRCHGPMRLIAFLTERSTIRALLAHLGEPSTAPPLTPRAGAPPDLEAEPVGSHGFAFDQSPPWDPTAAAPDSGYPSIRPGTDHPAHDVASCPRRRFSPLRHDGRGGEIPVPMRPSRPLPPMAPWLSRSRRPPAASTPVTRIITPYRLPAASDARSRLRHNGKDPFNLLSPHPHR